MTESTENDDEMVKLVAGFKGLSRGNLPATDCALHDGMPVTPSTISDLYAFPRLPEIRNFESYLQRTMLGQIGTEHHNVEHLLAL